jgi:CAAD domains of cyanobacterial aminoacyl-tRNA synthetase
MNPESKPTEVSQSAPVDIKTDKSGSLSTAAPSETATNIQEIKTQVLSVLSDLFTYAGQFFEEYQKPLTNIGLIVGVLVAFYLVVAVVDAINELPLLAPIFELIGIGYAIWFVKQYWSAEARTSLWANVQTFLDQVVGKKS